MALNFSRGQVFSSYHPSLEHNLGSSLQCPNGYFMDGKCDWSSESSIWVSKDSHCNGMEKTEKDGCGEAVNDDILARLPVDPFEMDMNSTFTAITGWFEGGFEKDSKSASDCSAMDEAEKKRNDDYGGVFSRLNWGWNSATSSMNKAEEKGDDDYGGVVAGLSWVWNSAMRFQSEVNDVKFDEISMPHDKINGFGVNNGFFDGSFVLNGSVEDSLGCMYVEDQVFNDGGKETGGCSLMDSQGQGDAHEAISYALRFLDIQDLLSVEMVCKSLRDVVRRDLFLWRNIFIGWPLSERITDDALLRLTSKAEGSLESLSMVWCRKITADGLKRVLDSNPKLTKLGLGCCLRIGVEGILSNLRAVKSAGTPRIKQLKVYGFLGLKNKHFEELKSLLDADNRVIAHKPIFYHERQPYIFSNDDDRAIDIETCPKCQSPTLLYDCPLESCREKHQAAQLCRACILCIPRCIHCGRCIKDLEYEETCWLELICMDCFENLLNDQEMVGDDKAVPSKYTIIYI